MVGWLPASRYLFERSFSLRKFAGFKRNLPRLELALGFRVDRLFLLLASFNILNLFLFCRKALDRLLRDSGELFRLLFFIGGHVGRSLVLMLGGERSHLLTRHHAVAISIQILGRHARAPHKCQGTKEKEDSGGGGGSGGTTSG